MASSAAGRAARRSPSIPAPTERPLELERAPIALLNALIEHMNDGVLAETDDGRVAVVNGAFCRMFGIPQIGTGNGWATSLVPAVIDQLAEPHEWSGRTSSDKGNASELRLKDGRVLESQYFPVRLEDERVITMWQFRDITGRKLAEEELRASRHGLRDLSAHLEQAREEERRELARALHDEVGQLLTGVRLEVAGAVEKFHHAQTPADFAVVDRLQAAVGLVDISIGTVRRITTALRPPMLDHLGLLSTIRWEAAVFERRTGIRCRVTSTPAQIETREHLTVLYRILLEALTNVARHAAAGTVWIRVRHRPRRLTMEVRDNGRGIGEEIMANPGTLGLLGMRERALAAGGELRVERLRTGGTSVMVSLPLDPARGQTAPTTADDA